MRTTFQAYLLLKYVLPLILDKTIFNSDIWEDNWILIAITTVRLITKPFLQGLRRLIGLEPRIPKL